MEQVNTFSKFLGMWCIMTGVFALIGSLYTWGAGVIFTVADPNLSLMTTDLVLTAPLSLFLGYSILKRKSWAKQLSLMVAGILIYGSIAVYSSELIQGGPYNALLLIPPFFGLIQSIFLIYWSQNTSHDLELCICKTINPIST